METQAPSASGSTPPTVTHEAQNPALEAIAIPVIVTDPTLSIRYLNTAALMLLREAQAALPWTAGDALGKSFALLCAESALRDRTRLPLTTTLELGAQRFELRAGPYYDRHGDYVGPILTLSQQARDAALEDQLRDVNGQVAAINNSQAVIEFSMDGEIQRVNQQFLELVGYDADEVVGRHHRMFVTAAVRSSTAYEQFWAALRRGEVQQGEFMRVAKHGGEVWLRASYTPILDGDGRPYKVVKYATDVTEDKRRALESQGQIQAIDRAMAVAEFELDGTIRAANHNFLTMMGYTLDEVRGRHHSLFVDEEYARGREYKRFWQALNDGEFQQAEFCRVGKGGKEVWIQASYNPVFDFEGRATAVVKYATDITAERRQRDQIQHLSAEAQRRAEDLQAQVAVVLEVVSAAANGDLTRAVSLSEGEAAMIELGAGLDRLIADLRGSIGSISEHANEVGVASNQLTSVSEQMAATADETSTQVQVVNDAAEDVSRNVTTVATGIEELGASMRDIAGSASEAAKIATRAVSVAQTTNESVSRLGESGVEIGKIVKLITSIAQQTNLLALNATIEAARAGEAGRGFAVVANEVKELAKETATATDEISTKIEAIQKSTATAVDAIEEIGRIIHQINEYQGAIAAAVEQQSTTTGAISRNVSEAARRSQEIAQNITSVAVAARDTAGAATDTQTAAVALRGMAEALQGMVGRFTI